MVLCNISGVKAEGTEMLGWIGGVFISLSRARCWGMVAFYCANLLWKVHMICIPSSNCFSFALCWLVMEECWHGCAVEDKSKAPLIYDHVAVAPVGEWREADVGVKKDPFQLTGYTATGEEKLSGHLLSWSKRG